ncbi:MarR family winged helix-turn-helix transcriptional regulator [Terriglobus sp.]|uniref:MarR family winged helix-turn-helix transcriptional regulator n=1 Tax=Terriglobus sp. TaxID=1889013 RepID=UPI003AFFF04E
MADQAQTEQQTGQPAAEATPSAASIWLVLMKAHRSLAALMEQSIASLGIGVSDFILLEALLHRGAMNISQLGEKVQLANSSMTAAVDRLVQRGLVERQSGTCDRRVRTVDLTPCGRALISKLFAKHEKDIDALMEPLCPEERAALRTSLKKVGLAAQARLEGQP